MPFIDSTCATQEKDPSPKAAGLNLTFYFNLHE
jgi:hypothetical protein